MYGIDDDQHGLGEIDNPPTVVETLGGAKVRAWLPVAALSHDDEIELDKQRAVKTTPSEEVVARVWLPVSSRTLSFAGDGARTSAPAETKRPPSRPD